MKSEYFKLYPNATLENLAGYDCYKFEAVTPAHSFQTLTLLRNEDILVFKTRDGIEKGIAKTILKLIGNEVFPVDSVWTRMCRDFGSSVFNQIAVIPPPYSACHSQSEILKPRSYWAFPCHTCEIQSGFNLNEFDKLIRRDGDIRFIDWQRQIRPQTRIKLLSSWPGGMLGKSSKAFLNRWESTLHIVKSMPVGVKVEILNSKGIQSTVEQTESGWVLMEGNNGQPYQIDSEVGLISMLKVFFEMPTMKST